MRHQCGDNQEIRPEWKMTENWRREKTEGKNDGQFKEEMNRQEDKNGGRGENWNKEEKKY